MELQPQRNERFPFLARRAHFGVKDGWTSDEVIALTMVANRTYCQPPLDDGCVAVIAQLVTELADKDDEESAALLAKLTPERQS